MDERERERCLAWERELDRLEQELQRYAHLLEVREPVEETAWSVPTVDGNLPRHLLARAQDIAQRQGSLMTALSAALQRRGREHHFVTQVDHATGEISSPAYVDLSA